MLHALEDLKTFHQQVQKYIKNVFKILIYFVVEYVANKKIQQQWITLDNLKMIVLVKYSLQRFSNYFWITMLQM